MARSHVAECFAHRARACLDTYLHVPRRPASAFPWDSQASDTTDYQLRGHNIAAPADLNHERYLWECSETVHRDRITSLALPVVQEPAYENLAETSTRPAVDAGILAVPESVRVPYCRKRACQESRPHDDHICFPCEQQQLCQRVFFCSQAATDLEDSGSP